MKHSRKSIFIILSMLLIAVCSMSAFAQTEAVETQTKQLAGQLTAEDIQQLNDNKAGIFVHNDRVTFVDGKLTDQPVKSVEDAAKVVLSMIGLLGGDDRVQFEPWRTLTDTVGNNYYVFRQMYAGSTVLNGAVKVITDAEGNMIAFSSSIETELPEEIESTEGITADEAVNVVLKYAEENGLPGLSVMEDLTDKMILPVVISVNDEEEDSAARFVWVVYSNNPVTNVDRTAELPYLAHYVAMDGTYLYSLETIMPGDAAVASGFDTEYVFEFMEPVDYTGYVDLSDGTEKEITVTLMRDRRTGMYYLGNIERKIVVADCYEFLYNNGRVKLASSPDNLEWDQVGLLSFYNYCRAYDFYKEIGWIGGNGLDMPIMILNDFCDENHNQIDNAAFMGNYLGWSLFAASQVNDFSQCLDVIAHEFTHCVTGSVMTYNSYMNDHGAINEAMSDILGEICEQMNGVAEEKKWILGNDSLTPVRSMNEPHRYAQPAFSWDLYYVPMVQTPGILNDYGGVHINSSLLNNVAYRLIENGGMSLEEARAFWFAVDCTMVPGSDFSQLRDLLPWVLKAQGMEQYQPALQTAIDAVRLGNDQMPDTFDADRALLKLTLPDNENFNDGNWVMQIVSVDVHGLLDRISTLFDMVVSGDYSELPQSIQDMFNGESEKALTPTPEPEKKDFFTELFDLLNGNLFKPEPTPEPVRDELTDAEIADLQNWISQELMDVYYSSMGSAGQDGRTIYMMSQHGRTIPILIHMSFQSDSYTADQIMFAIYFNNRWYEVPGVSEAFTNPEMTEEEQQQMESKLADSPLVQDLVDTVVNNITKIRNLDDVLNLFTMEIKGGEICEIPTTGLETIVLPEPSGTGLNFMDGTEYVPGRMSRPKLSEETPEPEII